MKKSAKAVLAEALKLETSERAEVAAELIASLDEGTDDDAETAWAEEIERRIADIDAGRTELTPWADVKGRIEKEILRR